MNEEKEIDVLIEQMKTEPIQGAVHVKQMIQTIEEKPDFYRKDDLLEVLWNRYDEVLHNNFDLVFNKLKKRG